MIYFSAVGNNGDQSAPPHPAVNHSTPGNPAPVPPHQYGLDIQTNWVELLNENHKWTSKCKGDWKGQAKKTLFLHNI